MEVVKCVQGLIKDRSVENSRVLINLMFSCYASWVVFGCFLMFPLRSPSGLWRGISFNGFSCVCMRAWRAVMIDDEMDEGQTRGSPFTHRDV